MDKYKNKPKTFFINCSDERYFQGKLNEKLSELFEEGAEIYEIKSFASVDYVYALIIYS